MFPTSITLFSLILLSVNGEVVLDNSCGDWTAYNDEKCFKIFDKVGLVTYSEAQTYCGGEGISAHLASIGYQEDQKFIETFLKSNKIVDNIWIGLKYNGKNYEWSDGTELKYVNWGSGSPKNNTANCVQIQTDDTEFGKWSDISCEKKNLVMCEKNQEWSIDQLQTAVMNLIKNPVPVGFIYVQLPNEQSPNDIWPWMTWTDISSHYAGLFFRAVGGNSSSFGQTQEENSPRLVRVHMVSLVYQDNTDVTVYADGQESKTLANFWHDNASGMRFTVSAGEVRPRNMAMRIWKRTQ